MSHPFYIFGASGVALELRELFEDVQASNQQHNIEHLEFAAFVGQEGVSGHSLIGAYISESQLRGQKELSGSFVIGIGSSKVRRKVSIFAQNLSLKPVSLQHPLSYVGRSSSISDVGTTVGVFTSITSNVEVGSFCFIDRNVTIGHDTQIKDFVSIYPSASISGNVKVESGATIGTGARILQGLTIGRDSFVGAGAVVTKDVNPGEVVVGVPAKAIER